MAHPVRPTYQAIVDQAVRATGASTGWLLAVTGSTLRVTAMAGLAAQHHPIGLELAPTGARGYVLSSAQPAALMPQPNDRANDGAAGFPGVPPSVVAVPCGDETPVGVLELAGKAGASPFTFDDIEAVALLASVAGAALSERNDVSIPVAAPADLVIGLERLAATDPRRYADTAQAIELLLGPPA
jgi:GAF domain-containing protein